MTKLLRPMALALTMTLLAGAAAAAPAGEAAPKPDAAAQAAIRYAGGMFHTKSVHVLGPTAYVAPTDTRGEVATVATDVKGEFRCRFELERATAETEQKDPQGAKVPAGQWRVHELDCRSVTSLRKAEAASTDAAGRYVMRASDKTLSAAASRWALYEGKRVVWEAIVDLPVADADALTQRAGLAQATSALDAFQRVASVLAAERRAGHPEVPALHACAPRKTAQVAMVVRTADQSPCGESLN